MHAYPQTLAVDPQIATDLRQSAWVSADMVHVCCDPEQGLLARDEALLAAHRNSCLA
jgi:hypothetical protein